MKQRNNESTASTTNRNTFRLILFGLIVSSMILLTGYSVFAEEMDREKIRVGFFDFDGYHMQENNGERSGYGYELIQMLGQYNNWDFEYVGFDQTWAESQNMLSEGKIDILTSAQKTEEREKRFDFSSRPVGTSSIILTVRSDNNKILQGDYSTYDGMRVGMIYGNSRNLSFKDFAAKKGFTYQEVLFNSTAELKTALLEDQSIDAIVTSNLRKISKETIIEQFDARPFYIIVRKGNTALLDNINRALELMDNNTPGWQTALFDTYYSPENEAGIYFNSEEKYFLDDFQESGTVVKAAFNPDRVPYSYWDENGKAAGILITLFEKACAQIGLSFEYLPIHSREEYFTSYQKNEADILIDAVINYNIAEKYDYQLSDSVITTGTAKISLKNNSGTSDCIAELSNNPVQNMMDKLLEGEKIEACKSMDECVNAVLNGSCKATYLPTYSAQYYISKDAKNQLAYSIIPEIQEKFTIATSKRFPYTFGNILNKGMNSLSNDFIDDTIIAATEKIQDNVSLNAFIYDNPTFFSLCIAILISLISGVLFLLARNRTVIREKIQADKLARYMGYVCQANDKVLEIDLERNVGIRYEEKNGQLQTDEIQNPFEDESSLQSIIHPEDYAIVRNKFTLDKINDLIKNGGKIYLEFRTKFHEAEYHWYAYTIQGITRTAETPNNIILFKKDIDATKKEEEKQRRILQDALALAQHASMAKGDFLSRMSHEIRTPLNAIIGYLSIAKMPDSKQEKIIHCIDNSEIAATHLLNIINKVLDMSSIESGRMKIACEDFDLKKQISTITLIFYNQAKEKGVQFSAAINNLTEEWVVGDPLRLNQVLMNLLSNSVKFTPAGGVINLTVTQKDISNEMVYVVFIISDTGIGMSEEYQKKLFTPFEQENAETAKNFGGTGLGLSITKNLITMMNGSIEVESHKGKGTTFTVAVSFKQSVKNKNLRINQTDYSKIRALVVDDEQNECDYVKALLHRCNIKCDTVNSGAAAIKQIQRRKNTSFKYDICIMDWNMPQFNGVETAKRIRESCDPEIPIIIATAYDLSDIETEAKAAGVTKIISKPIFQSTLFDLLANVFGNYETTEAKAMPLVDLSGSRILLVEDNEMNLEIATDVLKRSGLIVETACNGKQAVDLFMAKTPGYYQSILMDIQMPIMDGYTATKTIRASQHPEAKSIPIIAMTANAFNEDVIEAISCGMNDHISKPVDFHKLFEVLVKYIKTTE